MTLSYCQVRVPMYEYKYISHYWTVKQYYLSGHKLHFNIFFLNLVVMFADIFHSLRLILCVLPKNTQKHKIHSAPSWRRMRFVVIALFSFFHFDRYCNNIVIVKNLTLWQPHLGSDVLGTKYAVLTVSLSYSLISTQHSYEAINRAYVK